MKHIQPKTYQIMVAILSAVTFSQRMIWRLCNRTNKISIGQVNKVVNDLLRKGFVEELFRRKRLMNFEKERPIGKIIENPEHTDSLEEELLYVIQRMSTSG